MFERSRYARALEPLLDNAAGYARALLHNKHDAEDAVQPFRDWWFAILRNCCIDILRRAKKAPTENLADRDPPQPLHEEPADWERLAAAMKELSENHREILQLRYFGELSYDDLAEVLKISKGTVMSRLHFARKMLATHLREAVQ